MVTGVRSDDALPGSDGGGISWMTRKSWYAALAAALFFPFLAVLPPGSRETAPPRPAGAPLPHQPELFRDGDILARSGTSLISRMVLTADRRSPYSHIGLVKRLGGRPVVIHAVPGDDLDSSRPVTIESLVSYLSQDTTTAAALYRVRAEHAHLAGAAAEIAYSFALAGLPFDSGFDLATDDRLYCTELVWKAYRLAGLDLAAEGFEPLSIPLGRGPYLLPSTLLTSPSLEVIYEFHSER